MTRAPYRKRFASPARLVLGLATLALVSACGSPGEKEKEPCGLCGDMNDLRGSIASKNGSQSQMQGWVIAAFERDTQIARVGEIDSAGIYTLPHVRTQKPQTLALFTPDYILQAVLSIPGPNDKTVKQFVTFTKNVVPKLINDGPIVTFQNFDGLTIEKDLASDQNGDGIPDGAAHIQGLSLTGPDARGIEMAGGRRPFMLLADAPATTDTDQDGIPNSRDPDIDGDGVINVLDPDDDNDGVRDAFDGDQNGDLVPDNAPNGHNFDLYFSEGVEWISVQHDTKPKDDGSGTETSLKFTTKVRDNVAPFAVQIRGAPSLLNSATYIATDSTGQPSVQPWNRLLADDGASEDSGAGDRLFSKRVTLAAGKAPRSYEAVFFQLAFGSPQAPWYIEFPYLFPDVKPSSVTAQYDANTRTVLLIGNPFGDVQDFIWTITVWNSKGAAIWTSQEVKGTTRQFQVQENVLVKGETYKFSVVAQSLDKIPGYPAYTVSSVKYDLK